MPLRIFALAVLSGGILFPSALLAQGERTGIAFARADERSSGVCTGDTPEEAMACARAECAEGGVRPGDCLRVKWCFPAGWSADLFKQHREGPHWHEFLCGWTSKKAALQAAKVSCAEYLNPYLIECSIVRLFDERGNEVTVE